MNINRKKQNLIKINKLIDNLLKRKKKASIQNNNIHKEMRNIYIDRLFLFKKKKKS